MSTLVAYVSVDMAFYGDDDRVTKVSSGGTTFKYVYDENDRLYKIMDGQIEGAYTFVYDSFGRTTNVRISKNISSQTLVTNTYKSNNSNLLSKVTYGNGDYINYTYDNLDRLSSKSNEVTGNTYTYYYNRQNQLAVLYDELEFDTTFYNYDLAGRLVDTYRTNGYANPAGTLKYRTQYQYDEFNRLKGSIYDFEDLTRQTFEAIFGDAKLGQDAGRVYGVKWNGNEILDYTYDSLGRMTKRTMSSVGVVNPKFTTYTYEGGSNGSATTLIDRISTDNNIFFSYNYDYDEMNRITEMEEELYGESVTYAYDSLGRLVRENDDIANKTYTYTYDKYGNILTKKTHAFTDPEYTPPAATSTINYSYTTSYWKDQLTNYNGSAITYDGVGNALTWRDGMSFTWQAGRQMKTAKNTAGKTYTFYYNDDGIRYWKSGNGVSIQYYLDGTTILAEDRSDGNDIIYMHDENGNYVGLTYKGSTYYYVFNAQGDVVGLLNENGSTVARYRYDAWGKVIAVTNNYLSAITDATHVANVNPIRYRGYYYDVETGLYYLNSRYYDPTVGRFVNADSLLSADDMSGMNLYAYCGNDPVNRVDPTGHAWYHWLAGAAVVAAFAVATVVTAGGFAAGMLAVSAVGSGVAAATTASTIAAAGFIASATCYGAAVFEAASSSKTISDFNAKGNWGTVGSTLASGAFGSATAYGGSRGSAPSQSTSKQKVVSTVENDVINLPRIGSALKTDLYHSFSNLVDNYAGYATSSPISNGTLYQLQGSYNGVPGRFEWIIQNQQVTHRMFVPGGVINGIPIIPE